MPVSDVSDDIVFKKSSYSVQGACVEVGQTPGGGPVVAVRHSRRFGRESLLFTPDEWIAFVRGVKDGEFDLPFIPEQPAAQTS